MNDLIVSDAMSQAFPSLVQGLRKAQSILDSIKSFEDLERVFLQGAGLSPNTYRSYLQAVKQFYSFTEGKHPLQVTPGDIEAFYDDLAQRVDRNTAYLRIRGLKKFFEGIRRVLLSGVNYNYRLTTIKSTASFRPPWGGTEGGKIYPRFLEKHCHPVTLPSRHLLPS